MSLEMTSSGRIERGALGETEGRVRGRSALAGYLPAEPDAPVLVLERREGVAASVDLEAFESGAEGPWALIVVLDLLAELPKEDGLRLIEAAGNRLRPDGRIVVRVPNLSNPLNLRGRYAELSHRVGFSKESLDQFLRICGLEIVEIRGEVRTRKSRAARLLYDDLLFRAFRFFQRHTMQLKAEVERGESLWAVARRPAESLGAEPIAHAGVGREGKDRA